MAKVRTVYGPGLSILQGEHITFEQQLAAWLFVRWFTEPAQQTSWAEATNNFPVRISAAKDLGGLFAEMPQYETAWNLLLGAASKTEPIVGFDSYSAIRAEVQDASNTILTGGADVEATLEGLDTRVDDILARE